MMGRPIQAALRHRAKFGKIFPFVNNHSIAGVVTPTSGEIAQTLDRIDDGKRITQRFQQEGMQHFGSWRTCLIPNSNLSEPF